MVSGAKRTRSRGSSARKCVVASPTLDSVVYNLYIDRSDGASKSMSELTHKENILVNRLQPESACGKRFPACL